MKAAGLFVIGVVVGVLATTLIYWVGDRGTSESTVTEVAGAVVPSGSVALTPPTKEDTQKEDTQAAAAETDEKKDVLLPQPLAPEPMSAENGPGSRLERVVAMGNAAARRSDAERLLAAGFTAERIEWLADRARELNARRDRELEENLQKGLPDPYVGRYLADKDLDLREVIGDEEYTKYAGALGRSTAVRVKGVVPGSNAESVQLQTGDEITLYDGKRVYNYYDLQKTAAERKTGGSVVIEVRRNGQPMQVTLPPGDIGIAKPDLAEMLRREYR